jgi:hypothetical protein
MFRRSLAALAAMTIALGAGPGFAQPVPTVQAPAPRKAKRGLFGGFRVLTPRLYGTRGAAITAAQQKRVSRKTRNQARHKAHLRC